MAGKGQTPHGGECDHRERQGQATGLGPAWGLGVGSKE